MVAAPIPQIPDKRSESVDLQALSRRELEVLAAFKLFSEVAVAPGQARTVCQRASDAWLKMYLGHPPQAVADKRLRQGHLLEAQAWASSRS